MTLNDIKRYSAIPNVKSLEAIDVYPSIPVSKKTGTYHLSAFVVHYEWKSKNLLSAVPMDQEIIRCNLLSVYKPVLQFEL